MVAVVGGVTQVVIEVEDQERAKRFWTEKLGFELVQDTPYGEERWLEVRTPDKAMVLVLGVRQGERPTPPDPNLPTSNVMFYARVRYGLAGGQRGGGAATATATTAGVAGVAGQP